MMPWSCIDTNSASFVHSPNPEACPSNSQSTGLADIVEEKLAPGDIALVHLLRLLKVVKDGGNGIM
jgi:hypothetical protein